MRKSPTHANDGWTRRPYLTNPRPVNRSQAKAHGPHQSKHARKVRAQITRQPVAGGRARPVRKRG